MPARILNDPGRGRWSPGWNGAFPQRLSSSQPAGLVRLPAEFRETPVSRRIWRRMAGFSLAGMMVPVQGTARRRMATSLSTGMEWQPMPKRPSGWTMCIMKARISKRQSRRP